MSQNMISVTSLNTKIKSLLEATFMHTMVEGEVASVTYHTSGHLYFSIKDDKSAIRCVMWRSSVAKMKFRIEKGMHIVVEGSVSVYTPRGEYQFQTLRIEPYGQGALALAFEQLKEKLKSKGYFDAQRKKSIPKYIKKIALVTAKESAALHDMLKIIEKRWALVEVVIVDTLVQGDMASEQISKSLKYADTLQVDVVVVGRGGGSTEDLWCFNEEAVADTIFTMQTPVVSAVGHEVDVMISDFVADLRAPTPSAAMEMILPDSKEMLYILDEISDRFKQTTTQKIHYREQVLNHTEENLLRASPLRKLNESEIKFMQLQKEFQRVVAYKLEQFELQLPRLKQNLKQNMTFWIQQKIQHLSYIEKKIQISDPKLQCKKGWVQISSHGEALTLEGIDVHDTFTLADAYVKIDAVCLSKKKY